MQARHLPRAWGRLAPLTAAILGTAALAAPAQAAGPPAGGAPAPTLMVTYNTSSIIAEDLTATTATVTRGTGATIGTGTLVDSTDGAFSLNDAVTAIDGLPTGCWAGFTPQILPGDTVNVDGTAVTIPDITADPPVQEGNTVVVHGTAVGVDPAGLDVQLHSAGRFVGFGSAGGAFLSSLLQDVPTSVTFNGSSFTARFQGLGDQLTAAALSTAVVEVGAPEVEVAPGGVAPTAIFVDYQAGATGGPVGACAGSIYRPNEATGVSRSLVNVASAGQDLLVNGVAQPSAFASFVNLIDSTGRSVTVPAAGNVWSATVPASTLAQLADGPIKIGSTYNIGAGRTVGGLLSKDTTAPSAVTASIPSGQYASTQNVALRTNEGAIHYTTDGSDPSASSKTYTGAVSVSQTGPVKAIAIDGAGNASDIARFDYVIARPVVAPSAKPVARLPRLKVESLTLVKRLSLRSARKRGFDAIIYAPDGAKIAHIRILKGAKVIQTINRKVSRDGVLEVRMPTTKKTRKALKRGSYRVEIQLGQNLSNLGVKLVRNVSLK
jgi:Chitobiase/beta-hexosaminidase C-terminal domain